MLNQSLHNLPLIGLLRSEEVLMALIEHLIQPQLVLDKYVNYVECIEHTLHNLDEGMRRHGDLVGAASACLDGNVPYYGILDNYFKDLFTIDRHNICCRAGMEEEFSSICRIIHPYFICTWGLGEGLISGDLSLSGLEQTVNNITPLGIKVSPQKRFAENHVHFGGATETAINLLWVANHNPKESLTNQNYGPSLRAEYKGKSYETVQLEFTFRLLFKQINHLIIDDSTDNSIADQHRFRRELWKIQNKLQPNINDFGIDFDEITHFPKIAGHNIRCNLLRKAANEYHQREFDKSLFYYLTLLFTVYRSSESSSYLKVLIEAFCHLTNVLRSHMVMSQNSGLEHFIAFYSSPQRRRAPSELRTVNTAKSLIRNGTTHLEAKTGALPEKVLPELTLALHQSMAEIAQKCPTYNFPPPFILENGESDLWRFFIFPGQNKLYFHICFHFVKEKEKCLKFKGIKPVRFFHYRKKVDAQTVSIFKWLNTRGQEVSLLELYSQVKSLRPLVLLHRKALSKVKLDLRRLLRSIDAAGDENLTPPEVYAPYVRYLRQAFPSAGITHPDPDGERLRKPRLSFHAGEDFSHIITGMRRIDETVLFNEYEKEDRIGHGLAIGITPRHWLEHVRDVTMSKEEYLDNLVWLWRRAYEMLAHFPNAANFETIYRTQATTIGNDIYSPKEREYQIGDFYEAWRRRRNCPLVVLNEIQLSNAAKNPKKKCLIPDYCGKEKMQKATELFELYHTSIEVETRGKAKVQFRWEKHYTGRIDMITISNEELDFWEAIQDFQLTRYAKKGIILEANPSSNIYTGLFKQYHQHPIFRWCPPSKKGLLNKGEPFNKYGLRQGPIDVCLNSDDPGLFPTTLQNEFRLFRQAAEEHYDCCVVEAREWSEMLRKRGVGIFEENHISPYIS